MYGSTSSNGWFETLRPARFGASSRTSRITSGGIEYPARARNS